MSDDSKLIPELAGWNNGDGISIDAWISAVGRFDHALGYAAIFWPDFIEYDSCVFCAAPDPEAYQAWMRNAEGDRAKVEAMLNHIHLLDLFCNSEHKPTRELLLRLGQIMKESWTCKLAKNFPTRHFEIHFHTEGVNLIDLELTFYQKRP